MSLSMSIHPFLLFIIQFITLKLYVTHWWDIFFPISTDFVICKLKDVWRISWLKRLNLECCLDIKTYRYNHSFTSITVMTVITMTQCKAGPNYMLILLTLTWPVLTLPSRPLLTSKSPDHCLMKSFSSIVWINVISESPLMTIWFDLVWFCVPDIGERSGALKVDLCFWLVAGGLASVRVGRHAVETDLVAPGKKVWAKRLETWHIDTDKYKHRLA